MPMHDAHLVVHEGVYGFVEQTEGLIVSGCINHDGPIYKSRLVLDGDGEIAHVTVGYFVFIACNGLHQGL